MLCPHDSNGNALLVRASVAIAPFVYYAGLKFDGLGRLVISG